MDPLRLPGLGHCGFSEEELLLHLYLKASRQSALANFQEAQDAQDVALSVANVVLFDEYEREAAVLLPRGERLPSTFNAKGLPIRPEEIDCKYYMRTGCCDYGASCKFNHPEMAQLSPSGSISSQSSYGRSHGIRPSKPTSHQPPRKRESRPAPPPVTLTHAGYPRREGEMVCRFYMKTGFCGYGAECRFDHPPPEAAAAMALNMYSISRLSLR